MSCAKSIACYNGVKLKNFVSFNATLLEPFNEYIKPEFQLKASSFQLPYQPHSSSADYPRELFKSSNGPAVF